MTVGSWQGLELNLILAWAGGSALASVLLLIGTLLWAIASVLAAFHVWQAYFDPRSLHQAAQRALERGDTAEVVRLYERVARMEGRRISPARVQRYQPIFTAAHLTLGEIYLAAGNREAAFRHYTRAGALGALLPPAALALLAETCADKSDRSSQAAEAYLAYAALRPPSGPSDKVYKALQSLCVVTEATPAAGRKQAAELNRRVIAARPDIEWAHYYLGLALLFDRDPAAALAAFARAQALNPRRALTYYWLGVCCLQQPQPDLERATQVFSRFLAGSSDNPKFIERQERAALELAKRLVARVGGFDTTADCRSGENQSILSRTITYLEYAAAKNPSGVASRFYLGRAHSLTGDSAKAIAAFQRAAQLAGAREPRQAACNLAQCLYRLGLEQHRAGLPAEARDSLERAATREPDLAEARGLLSRLCLEARDYPAAETHARAILRLRGFQLPYAACLVQALYHQGRFGEVAAQVEGWPVFVVSGPEAQEAAFLIARSLSRLGRFQEAVPWYNQLPAESRVLYYHGCALAHCERYDAALERFEETIRLGGSLATPALIQRGHLQLRRGDAAAAQSSYLLAQARAPGDSSVLYGLGCVYSRSGDLEKAAECFSRLLARDPSDHRARFALGLAEDRRGNAVEAIAHYSALPPGAVPDKTLEVRLGVLLCRQFQYAAAVEQLEPLLRSGQQDDAVLFYLGTALLFRERPAETVDLWSRLYERHPDDERLALNIARARYTLGAQHVAQGRYLEAAAEWERYLERYPEDDKTAQNLAQIYFCLAMRELQGQPEGRLGQAPELLRQALERDRNDPRANYYYALCALKLNQYDECLARLRWLAASAPEPRVVYHLGLCLLRKGETGQAFQVLEDLATRDSQSDCGRLAGWIVANEHIRAGRYEEAAAALSSRFPAAREEVLT